ncbi:hypothetical protein J6590_102731 [Homalodisca vitripennis]|nr:hypothetical protein J6590_102731 [Homalodisca vitripennis]
MKEGYHVAAQYFPITYKKPGKPSRLGLSYSQVAQLDFTDDEIYPTLPSSQASTPISQLNVSNRYTPLLAVSEPSSSRQQPFSSQFKMTLFYTPLENISRQSTQTCNTLSAQYNQTSVNSIWNSMQPKVR